MSDLPVAKLLPARSAGETERGPLLVFLHWLGGGARTWEKVTAGLAARGYRSLALDLPGFGEAGADARYSVAAMADAVAGTIAAALETRRKDGEETAWILAGHSMGGKVAAVVARAAADGDPRVRGLRGLVLVSPSPASVEPIAESKREQLIADLGGAPAAEDEDRARAFVLANVGKPALSDADVATATRLVLSMNHAAFRAWLAAGSKEDWAERVGRLPQPMVVLYGSAESPLGEDAQRAFVDRHASAALDASAELVALEGAGHLGPLERSGDIVDHVDRFAVSLGLGAQLSRTASQLVVSTLTSPATREALLERISPKPVPPAEAAFSEPLLATLRALVTRIVPGAPASVALRVHRAIAEGRGDGWRPASLPADRAAWTSALERLEGAARSAHGTSFVSLDGQAQDAILRALEAPDDKAWFADARAEIVKTYVSDPRTLDRIGFRGFADENGFTQIRLGEREDFE